MNVISIPVEIKKPDLWFPNGYGKQPLYQFKTSVRVGGRTVDERESRTGLRKIVLRQDVDQWGRQFAFEVNGILIFVKGADVIPFDSFPARVTTERYKQFLGAAVQAHMNMVRLWGGGYYESDEFYNLCDEMGLLVWQDFMFASSWYPGRRNGRRQCRRRRSIRSADYAIIPASHFGRETTRSSLYCTDFWKSERRREAAGLEELLDYLQRCVASRDRAHRSRDSVLAQFPEFGL